MDISKYIYDYLMENNKPVILPDVGRFAIAEKSSEIRDGIVFPPVKTIDFDIYNKTDDHELASYIAQKANISTEEAGKAVQNFCSENFIYKLMVEKHISFENFGSFTMNEIGNVTFEPDAGLFKDNYGLGNAFIQGNIPSEPTVTIPVSVPPPPPPPPPLPPPPPPTASSEPIEVQPDPGSNLFDMNNTRFRENTERRRPEIETPPPPVRPNRPSKTPPPKKKKEPKPKKTDGSKLWLLWVLLIAVGLGAGGYFLYPVVKEKFFSPTTPVNTIVFEEAPADEGETEEETPNTELAQTLDNATDKKNVLIPTENQQTTTSQPQATTSQSQPSTSQTQSISSTSRSEPSKSGAVTGGRYVLIVGSFTTYTQAEKYGKTLQANGIDYEIVDAGNQRFRVSVASYDNLSEATQQANLMKSKPYCEGVWVAKR